MPRRCSICDHKNRAKIEAAMLAQGGSNRSIASRWKLSPAAVQRHKDNHLAPVVARVEAKREENVGELWRSLKSRALRIADEAEKDENRKDELAAIRELTRLAELGVKAHESLQKKSQSASIDQHGQWPELIDVLTNVLAQHPQALADMRAALVKIGAP